MHQYAKKQTIIDLRQRISALERHPVLAENNAPGKTASQIILRTPKGVLHEVWTDETRNAGATLGFSLGQARGLLTPSRQAVLWLQLAHDSQEIGLPYGAGLAGFGFDPRRLVIGRVQKIKDLLWAAEEAIACRSVAAIVADIGHPSKILDFTATRRLALRAQSGGTSLFLLRYGHQREVSAAAYRWRVHPTLSTPMPFDTRAPGGVRWHVQLEKGHGLKGSHKENNDWILNWTKNGFELDENRQGGVQHRTATTALSGAQPAPLGHRLSETA